MIQLAPNTECTSCGACAYICPHDCITMRTDSTLYGAIRPTVDSTKCVSCKLCQKVCPIISPLQYNSPLKAYAAWSSNEEERRTSASGGIGAEVYKKTLDDGGWIAGAKQNKDFSVTLHTSKEKGAISEFKNSKYVFSSAISLYKEIKDLLTKGERITVVGLPCQIAAIRRIFRDNINLLLIDVVCHGTTPHDYLVQHIQKLENECKEKTTRMSFRDPNKLTYTYTFTLYNKEGKLFYAKRTKDGDTYQYGYHKAISYQENCYHCHFAKDKRISDITLSDYKGLGKLAPCQYNELKVSSILVNTPKGKAFIEQIINEKRIVAEERPVGEPIKGDAQLRCPSKKQHARLDFERLIVENNGDFEKSMTEVIQKNKEREIFKTVVGLPKSVLSKIYRSIFRK